MSDPIKVVKALILANSGVLALTSKVFGGVLPEHYDPSSIVGTSTRIDGPAIVLNVIGGTPEPEMPVQKMTVQVSCWAGINQYLAARQVYYAVFAALHGQANLDFGDDGKLLSLLEQTSGRDVVDPDTGWIQVVASFDVQLTGGVSITSSISANQSVKSYVDSGDAATLAAAKAYTDSHGSGLQAGDTISGGTF